MSQAQSTIRFHLDPRNPGQFLACCGLLELSHRLWGRVEGSFDREGCFLLRAVDTIPEFTALTLLDHITSCSLTNTMTESELERRNTLSAIPRRDQDASIKAEKKGLDALWRKSPVELRAPFHLRLDWFLDTRAGGSMFKTWAGQQSVVDIASGMKNAIDASAWRQAATESWLSKRVKVDDLPFNFDSALGGIGSDLDVGFSFDPLATINVGVRPLLEFLAFVGLQRFRPVRLGKENRFEYSLWLEPMSCEIASVACAGLLAAPSSRVFQFRLLYRTKYLKSFLPSTPI